MSKNRVFLLIGCLTMGAVGLFLLVSSGRAADRSREYVVAVDPQKSDTVRMIEAYERLSSQYLNLVQHNLVQMAAANRDILDKLNAIEKKLDDIADRLSRLEPKTTQESKTQ